MIQSNKIGTDASGTKAFGNSLTAIAVFGGTADTTIGSLTGQGNLISGNLSDGIDITGAGTEGNYVAGNSSARTGPVPPRLATSGAESKSVTDRR